MRNFDFKKSVLAIAALAMSFTASAQEKTVLYEDFEPAGTSFEKTTAVDWDTQKVHAVIDVDQCTGTNENILSVGSNIASWGIEGYHVYYTASTKTLQINYCRASQHTPIRETLTEEISGKVTIDIVKGQGIVINGEAHNTINTEYGTYTATDSLEAMDAFWALTEVQVGSQQGSNRSNAHYDEVSLSPLAETPAEPQVINLYDDNMDMWSAPTITEPVTVHLCHSLNLNHWNTISLPFTTTAAQTKAQFGDDVKIGEWTGFDEDGVLQFTSVDSLEAGKPYVILPTKAPAIVLNEDTAYYEFTDVAAFVDEPDQETMFNNVGFFGFFEMNAVGAGSGAWQLTDSGFVAPTEDTEFLAFQAILYAMDEDANLRRWALDGTEITEPDKPIDPVDPVDPTNKIVIAENLTPDGAGFKYTPDIDWDKQYVKAVIDMTTCTSATENILSFGQETGQWEPTQEGNEVVHMYYGIGATKFTVYTCINGNNRYADAVENNSFAAKTIECVISKADGLTVDGEQLIAPEYLDKIFDKTTIELSDNEGSTQASHATYNEIAIYPIEDTPTAIETLKPATTTTFNVYGINGQLLKKGASDINDLPRGIYVVNGKKVLK